MRDDSLPPAHPAEAAILASGLRVEPREMPQLTRLVARRLPADRDAVADALCQVRRKAWASAAMAMASRAGELWVRRAEAEAAAASLTDPEAGEAALRRALDAAITARLRHAAPRPGAALEAIEAEIIDVSGTPLSAERHAALALAVARAHGMDEAETARFARAAAHVEERRRQDLRAAEKAAREKRREEVTRLRAWEKSLVGLEGVPGLLRCSEREALRWAGAGLLPVARRIPGRGGREIWQFDPAEITALRRFLPEWRAAERSPSPRAERERDGHAPAHRPERPQRLDRAEALAGRGGKAANAAVARAAALDRYAAHFATARALVRRFIIVTGPTNSGKSHTALDRLAQAESGLALAPLRLLAHEFREALASRGVEAALSTGEERILAPGSKHLAATVEMCPFHSPVDVAIIDEAQLLHDRDRGAAWTAALMGVPAREVFVLGAPECVPMVKRIAQLCGDEVEEITLQRKGPLHASTKPVPMGELKQGDALVAFSRRDVMDLREALVARGRKVAVVYGALSPEVRRAEAARFRNGEADIIVATDAIGMGLNLPIRRVVFSTLRKFDGEERRELTSQEVKQIGGRAGRYGHHEGGVVSVLAGGGDPSFVQAMLEAPPAPPEELRPQVQPDADIIAAVAAEIGTDSLFGVLARIKRAVLRKDDPNYRLADLTQQLAIASAIDGVAGLSLADRWTYAMCPVDERDNGITRLARWAVDHGGGRPVAPPLAGRLPAPERATGEELQRAEKVHKRLVAWRWLALRFPAAYLDRDEAEAETERLDSWIEDVLRQQRRARRAA
ncbi:helicase-related protein [Pseudoroseomonas cervicalis]|uniref:helicase-related protein n=1 Tax=Teichococcus cervicalis TaxID=204525 RepID=UPI002785C35A|nr:helicase-related protein [Pseudoroseomonas cervicalis]MDQ1081356.1 ATP-dependent RNA helicase SUPV3L1/SUV3 [Pseudoroseomonas cervicalis]